MKYTGTIVCSGLSGSAGDVTASRWKGLGYFRTRVIPANPNSADQVLQRGHFTDIVSWWHDVEEQLQDEAKRLAYGMALSGFNAFVKRNLKDLAGFDYLVPVETWPRIMPLNAVVNPVADDLVAAVGTVASKDLILTWSQGEAAAADKVYVLAGEATADGDVPKNLFLVEKETTAADTETLTVSMPVADQGYQVWLLVEKVADSTFSIARSAWATSKA